MHVDLLFSIRDGVLLLNSVLLFRRFLLLHGQPAFGLVPFNSLRFRADSVRFGLVRTRPARAEHGAVDLRRAQTVPAGVGAARQGMEKDSVAYQDAHGRADPDSRAEVLPEGREGEAERRHRRRARGGFR